MNTDEQVGPDAVVKWVRDAMDLDRAPEAMGRASLTLTYIAPDGREHVTEVPMLDLSRDHAVATVSYDREFYTEDVGPYYSPVAARPTPVADWYSVLIHAPVRPADGQDHAWTETVTDPVLVFLHRMENEHAGADRVLRSTLRRLIEIREEETGWPTTPST